MATQGSKLVEICSSFKKTIIPYTSFEVITTKYIFLKQFNITFFIYYLLLSCKPNS